MFYRSLSWGAHTFVDVSADCTYVDHAGATLYARSQLGGAFQELSAGVFGNPHSHHGPSAPEHSTAGKVARVRRQVLGFFNASEDEYALVFTSGATAALKLVGECFPWSNDSVFAHAVDSHTSVLGIRGYAARHGAEVSCVGLDELERLGRPQYESNQTAEAEGQAAASLFAFPAECNFSGVLHPLTVIESVRQGRWAPPDASTHHSTTNTRPAKWFVLLDAAKYVATHPMDLSTHHPDFVVMSFYKLFGYPTGLGALLVRKTALPYLQKTYYGGGTVKSILATSNLLVPRDATDALDARDGSSPFADGTQSYLSILSLRHGFEQLEKLGMVNVEAHTASLTRLLAASLAARTHWNGRPICELYGNHRDNKERGHGSIVACNFLRADGSYVGYAEVHKLAEIHNIRLRTGCFCNPGACQQYLRLTDADLLANIEAGHVCGDDVDIVDGRPTGAVRLSVGYMTTFEDIAAVLEFVDKYFVSRAATAVTDVGSAATPTKNPVGGAILRKITLFPIKSCAGMAVSAWPVGARGLLFDREWAIVDASSGAALSLKDTPQLCFLRPSVDLKRQTLTITFSDRDGNGEASFTMPLHGDGAAETTKSAGGGDPRDIRVCSGACKANEAGDAASEWISARLDRPCALVRVSSNHLRKSTADQPKHKSKKKPTPRESGPNPADSDPDSASSPKKPAIGFANQAQYLLISRQSITSLNKVLASVSGSGSSMQVDEDAFRANFVVDGCVEPFVEDQWRRLRIGDALFDVSGPCSRCSVINMDQRTGAFDRRPLQALSSFRRERSSIFFGQYLTRRPIAQVDGSTSGHGTASSGGGDDVAGVSGGGDGIVWLRALDPVAVEAVGDRPL